MTSLGWWQLLPSIVSCLLVTSTAFAEAPPLVSFQGKLTDVTGVPVADGSYSMRFRVYSSAVGDAGDPCAGSCVWEEVQNVSTRSGIYNVLLGSVDPLTASAFAASVDTSNPAISRHFKTGH